MGSTFTEFAEWGVLTRGWKASTARRYISRVKAADEWLCSERLESILFADSRDLRMYLFRTAPAPATRRFTRTALIGFYDFLNDFPEARPIVDFVIATGARELNPAREV